jgi:hypothetical protein
MRILALSALLLSALALPLASPPASASGTCGYGPVLVPGEPIYGDVKPGDTEYFIAPATRAVALVGYQAEVELKVYSNSCLAGTLECTSDPTYLDGYRYEEACPVLLATVVYHYVAVTNLSPSYVAYFAVVSA